MAKPKYKEGDVVAARVWPRGFRSELVGAARVVAVYRSFWGKVRYDVIMKQKEKALGSDEWSDYQTVIHTVEETQLYPVDIL